MLALDATIAQACEVFVYEKEQSQTVEDTTMESYRSTIRHVVNPACGNLPLKDLSVLRTFVDDNAEALQQAGIDPTEFSTHIFRRSTATIIDAAAGITLASRLLGHASEQVTRSNYVVTAEMVDPVTADIMDDAFTAMLGTADGSLEGDLL